MIVLDANAAVAMVLGTEEGDALRMLMLEGEKAIAPDLFCSEVSNVFWQYRRSDKLGEDEARLASEYALSLVDEMRPAAPLMVEALNEAMRLEHPVYDMLYFVLARREGATLLTLDKKLVGLCQENGVNCVCGCQI